MVSRVIPIAKPVIDEERNGVADVRGTTILAQPPSGDPGFDPAARSERIDEDARHTKASGRLHVDGVGIVLTVVWVRTRPETLLEGDK
jgi:hypothetical protein